MVNGNLLNFGKRYDVKNLEQYLIFMPFLSSKEILQFQLVFIHNMSCYYVIASCFMFCPLNFVLIRQISYIIYELMSVFLMNIIFASAKLSNISAELTKSRLYRRIKKLAAFLVRILLIFLRNSLYICFFLSEKLKRSSCLYRLYFSESEKHINTQFQKNSDLKNS